MARYQEFPFHGFGKGLNLRDKPDAVDPAECIDAMNVLFSDRGAIVQRSGYAMLTEDTLTNRVESLSPYYTTGGARQLLAGCGTRLEALSTSGEALDSETGLTDAVWDFARFGKPNSEVVYAGNGTDTLRRWNGVEWSAPNATVDGEAGKAMPKAGSLAAWAEGDNRLVATRFATATGGPNGKVSSPSHVYFSDAGNPESWEGTALAQLSPGDGEAIQAAVVWRELLFVFKESKFFVFDRGVVDDVEGKPEFPFRAVEAGVGLASPRAVCAHSSGVYFMSRGGVYVTTGQEPELVSSPVEPIWSGEISSFYTGGTLAHSSIENCAMTAHRDRIYLSFPTDSTNNRTLVYDPQFEWWSLLSLPCSALATFRVGSSEELVFGYAAGGNHVGRHSPAFTNDDGAATESHWRMGWPDLGSPSVKKVRAQKVWGAGKVSMAVSHDFRQSVGTLTPLDFTDPEGTDWGEKDWGEFDWAEPKALLPAHRRVAVRGTVFSVYFENRIKDQGFAVHRLELLVPEVRDPAKADA